MTKNQYIILGAAVVIGALIVASHYGLLKNRQAQFETVTDAPADEIGQAVPEVLPEPTKPVAPPLVVPEGPKEGQEYYRYTMKTANAQKELAGLVGEDNVMAVLQTNRIDAANIKMGAAIVIPTAFDLATRSPFPLELSAASDVSKLLLFSQRVQAFGVYEAGKLVRWGPINSGKESTKTPNKLFSTNWKGKEIKSSFDDEWILKYNFNIDNFAGIGFHQYSMPGYPASHSCIRMLMEDAMWLYDWADQWILSADGQTRLAHGTPVIVFGDYAFNKTAPWKLLPDDPDATDISVAEIEAVLSGNLDTILSRQTERANILSAAAVQ